MEFKVKWENLDQESKQKDVSRAKVVTLSLGDKKIRSPSRGIKVSKTTSDFQLWNEITKNILPPLGLAFIHRGMETRTLKNISTTNGKFNKKVREASEILGRIDDEIIKIIYPRIPKSQSAGIVLKEKEIKANLDFLNLTKGNDANILPLTPTKELIDNIAEVEKGISAVYSTTDKGKQKPLVGYIPGFEDPNHAERLIEMYLRLDDVSVNTFVIDFNNGRRERTANVVIRRLLGAQKKEGLGDFYVHAVNVLKDVYKRKPFSPFYDLPLVTEGIDSFHNNLIAAGPPKQKANQSIADYNKSKKFPIQSQYGSFNFEELRKHDLLQEICECPACEKKSLEDLFSNQNSGLFEKMIAVHRIHLVLQEEEEQRRIITEKKSLVDYLRSKPMATSQVDGIMSILKERV